MEFNEKSSNFQNVYLHLKILFQLKKQQNVFNCTSISNFRV